MMLDVHSMVDLIVTSYVGMNAHRIIRIALKL
jgi:hypothetical protein